MPIADYVSTKFTSLTTAVNVEGDVWQWRPSLVVNTVAAEAVENICLVDDLSPAKNIIFNEVYWNTSTLDQGS